MKASKRNHIKLVQKVKLGVHKLKTVPVDFRKLNNAVDNNIVKKSV